MLRVGLTGGIACGKSVILGRLSARGLATLDLDAVAHEVMAPGGAAYDDVVAAIGRAGLVRADFVKPGAVVVDVGMNRVEDPAQARDLLVPSRLANFEKRGYALVGDVHAPSVAPIAGALTPVPGGVGPLTIALLLKNTVRAAADARGTGP